MQYGQETIVAQATASGVGAIAVLRLSGPEAISICNGVFKGKNLNEQPTHTLHYGSIRDGEKLVDEVVVSLFKNPNSYTGEDVVEISCHASPFIIKELLNLFVQHGARMAKPGEFTMRAFLAGKLDLSQAEAVADVIASNSAASHKVAMQQMRGGFSREIQKLREKLVNFASLIELELDFSEEDVEFADRTALNNLLNELHRLMSALISSFELGNAIRNGIPVVIAGKPNAGKSTLLNALLQDDRAIVSEVAGTTRDTIEEELNVNGSIFRLIDTAGLRDTADAVEAIGVEKTLEKIRSSAIVAYLFDVHESTAGSLRQTVNELRKSIGDDTTPLLLVGNKIDLEDESRIENEFKDFENVILISAKRLHNIEQLKSKLSELAQLNSGSAEDTVVTNARHLEALTKADDSVVRVMDGLQILSGDLLAQDIRQALNYLGEITGEVTNDEILGNIFSKFCIGK